MIHIIPSLTAFAATFLFLLFSYKFAVSINLVDRPDHRKKHQGIVPLIGGIAIIFGFSLACLVSPRSLAEWRPLFLCIIPLAAVGVVDDHGDISIKKRILVQITSCLVMIYYGNNKINSFGDLTGFGVFLTFGGLESVITVICVVGVINALNLIDGIDGLCPAICLVTFGGILTLVKLTGAAASISLILYFSSGLIAFLIVNLGLTQRLVKKVFLGDAGTTIIGFFLCWYLILMSDGSDAVFRPITSVWLLALPIMDTLAVMVRRVRSNKSPFEAGRDHIHHQLLNAGFSPRKVLGILFVVAVLLAIIGIILEVNKVPESFMFYGILCLFGLYLVVLGKMKKKSRLKPDES